MNNPNSLDKPEALPGVACSAWLADQRLYLVTGLWGSHSTAKLFVLAEDSGKAEAKARATWRAWQYNHEPTEVKLVGRGKQYGPEGIITVVG